jgi:hypothetical protein
VNVAKLTEEAVATEEQRRNQRYVDDPDVDASVITINAMSVGWAVNDFMHYATGLGRPPTGFRLLRSRPVVPGDLQLTLQEPDADADCHVCGIKPYVGRRKTERRGSLGIGRGHDLQQMAETVVANTMPR